MIVMKFFLILLIILSVNSLIHAQAYRAIIGLAPGECTAYIGTPLECAEALRAYSEDIRLELLLPDTVTFLNEMLVEKFFGKFYNKIGFDSVITNKALFESMNPSPRCHIHLLLGDSIVYSNLAGLFIEEQQEVLIEKFTYTYRLKIDTLWTAPHSKRYSFIGNKVLFASKEKAVIYNHDNTNSNLLTITPGKIIPHELSLSMYNTIAARLEKPPLTEEDFVKFQKKVYRERMPVFQILSIGELTTNGMFPAAGVFHSSEKDGAIGYNWIIVLFNTELSMVNVFPLDKDMLLSKNFKVPFKLLPQAGLFDTPLLYLPEKNSLHIKLLSPDYLETKTLENSVTLQDLYLSAKFKIIGDSLTYIGMDVPVMTQKHLEKGWLYYNNDIFYATNNMSAYVIFGRVNRAFAYNLNTVEPPVRILNKDESVEYFYNFILENGNMQFCYSIDNSFSKNFWKSVNIDSGKTDFHLELPNFVSPYYKVTKEGIYALGWNPTLKNNAITLYFIQKVRTN